MIIIIMEQRINSIVQQVINEFVQKTKAESLLYEQICRNIIKEEMSFSQDVYDIADKIYDMMIWNIDNGNPIHSREQNYPYTDENNQECHGSVETSTYVIDISQEMAKVCATIKKLMVTVISFSNFEIYTSHYREFHFEGDFSPQTHSINLTIPRFEGKFNANNIMPLLAHEVEHLYQYQMAIDHRNPISGSTLYNNALEYMESANPLLKDIALLAYFFYDMEIDARAQEIYRELERNYKNGEELSYTNTSVWEMYQKLRQKFINLCQMNQTEVGLQTRKLGLHRGQFLRLIRVQMNKFVWKIERIWRQFNKRLTQENKFHIERRIMK